MSLHARRLWLLFAALSAALACSACDGDDAPPPQPTLSREELMKPETCMGCHPTHYAEWKASMHAYAAEDPVFRAMNALGQEETDGGMGDLCVQCHAPMALRENETTDGLNLDEVPEHLKGVTCYFCHNVVSVDGDHNAQLTLANDTIMRGAIIDPVKPSAHGVSFSRFMDRNNPESSRMCGACHDIVNDNDVHLERTFAEYEASIFGDYEEPSFMSCSRCHMRERDDLAAMDPDRDVGLRRVHSHLFPGVDVALTDWPDREEYKQLVECELGDASAIYTDDGFSYDGMGGISVMLDTNAGHNFPSGSSQDRRLWLEVTAFDSKGGQLCQSGGVPDGEAVATFRDPDPCDPGGFAIFRDRIFDDAGMETHMFWRAAKSDDFPAGFDNYSLMPLQIDGGLHTQTVTMQVELQPDLSPPARIRMRLRLRAMDHDVLDELVETGHLDESIPDEIPTFDIIGGEREWVWNGFEYVQQPEPERTLDCQAVRCKLTPDPALCNE